jgi:translation initiation factor IF-2
MRNGIMVSINQVISFEMATLVTSAFGIRARREEAAVPTSAHTSQGEVDRANLVTRPPVVTILGHVDHGKTTLLDTIRKSRVAESEVGNITQHIGAYQVKYKEQEITFLDTPGHEAFAAIRARGASVTDIAVLVVAADDGVMPQTVEALDHAKAAKVPIVVAINKMDRPGADADKVKRQLNERGLLVEEWGGDTICVPISATRGEGIEDLLENLLAVAEVGELKADPTRPATGAVIEARLDKTRGPLATVLVQNGTLRVGDRVIAGTAWGRVKAMANDVGVRLPEATPSVPVEVMGFNSTPEAGDVFEVVADEQALRDTADQRARGKDSDRSGPALTLENIYTGLTPGETKEVNLVIKADVQGSVEAVSSALRRLDEAQAKVRILHAGSGTITESDVLLASASRAIVVGFGTTTQPGVDRLAEREGVEIRHYDIIYHLIEDIEKALQGALEATYREVVQGHATIRAIFPMGKRGKIAGCVVNDGRISRNAPVRLLRDGQVLHEGTISSLRHFKEEVNEMAAGFECGVGLAGYDDFQEGDVLETYRREKGRA